MRVDHNVRAGDPAVLPRRVGCARIISIRSMASMPLSQGNSTGKGQRRALGLLDRRGLDPHSRAWSTRPVSVGTALPVDLIRPARSAGAMFIAGDWTSPVNTQFARHVGRHQSRVYG